MGVSSSTGILLRLANVDTCHMLGRTQRHHSSWLANSNLSLVFLKQVIVPLNDHHKSLRRLLGVHSWLLLLSNILSREAWSLIYTRLHWLRQTLRLLGITSLLPCNLLETIKIVEDRSHPIFWGLDRKHFYFVSAWFYLYFNMNSLRLVEFSWWSKLCQLISSAILFPWDL